MPDRGVDRAEPDGGQADLGLGLDERHLEPRMRVRQRDQRARQHGARERRERRDPQRAGEVGRPPLEVGARVLELLEDALGAIHEAARRLREPDAAARPLDERDTALALEHGDLLGHGRGREAERLGGAGDASAQRDLAQEPEAADVEHAATLKSQRPIVYLIFTLGSGTVGG